MDNKFRVGDFVLIGFRDYLSNSDKVDVVKKYYDNEIKHLIVENLITKDFYGKCEEV